MLVPNSNSAKHRPMEVGPATKFWRSVWMAGAALAAIAVIFFLVRPTHSNDAGQITRAHSLDQSGDFVRVTAPREVYIKPGTPLARNLGTATVTKTTVSYPLLTVTSSVVARIRPGDEPIEERWQFASAEIAGDYVDWLKTKADIEFNRSQLQTTRELTQAQIQRNEEIVARYHSLGRESNVPRKDVIAAEADLVQVRLQGQKDLFAAETALRVAVRQLSALERQLAQVGIEPIVFSRAREGMVLISANVPEAKISAIKVGQSCEARFYGFPNVVYSAHVEELGSVLSTERRTLRVLFDLTDGKNQLKPGMFAEVGLGTDERDALLIPANATLHIGRVDYVFKQAADGAHYQVTEVQISEAHNEQVEVLKGLSPGDHIAGAEAVLLKPVAIQSLNLQSAANDR